jgi:hydroxylamine dehydrogenase
MSGLEGQAMTHDTTQRLSWFLFADISEKRPTYAQGRDTMQDTCMKCHAQTQVAEFYAAAEDVLLNVGRVASAARGRRLLRQLRAVAARSRSEWLLRGA